MSVAPIKLTHTGSLIQQYTVQPHDTLLKIANVFKVPMFQLMSLNGIDDPDAISEGQTLVIRKGVSRSGRTGE
jgi:LysM repeat protein